MDPTKTKVDRELAQTQWEQLKNHYLQLLQEDVLDDVAEIIPGPGLEDMVFCANQSFPWVAESGDKKVILSKMRHPSRAKEVPFFRDWYVQRGYEILELEHTQLFEGMGDLIQIPGRNLLVGGYGFRTEPTAYDEISQLLDVEILRVELCNPKFYHLDTCILLLDGETALACRSAFTPQSWTDLQNCFTTLLEADEDEAVKGFALNAHILPSADFEQKFAIIQNGNPKTCELLKNGGFVVLETETSEFMKSGGSVFCMKMMVY